MTNNQKPERPPARIVRAVELSPSALQSLRRLKQEEGMSQVELLSRTVEWLASRTPQQRLAVLRWATTQRHQEN